MNTDQLNKLFDVLIKVGLHANLTIPEADLWEEFCEVMMNIFEEKTRE